MPQKLTNLARRYQKLWLNTMPKIGLYVRMVHANNNNVNFVKLLLTILEEHVHKISNLKIQKNVDIAVML